MCMYVYIYTHMGGCMYEPIYYIVVQHNVIYDII